MDGERWTVLKLIEWTKDYLAEAGLPNPRLEAEVLLARVLDMTRVQIYTQYDSVPSREERARFKELIRRRIAGEPSQYLTHRAEFYSVPLFVDKRVLIPRPETEVLVDVAVAGVEDRNAPLRVADLGTGSGCIALALAKTLPNAVIYAVDRSEDALEVARRNIHDTKFEERVKVFSGDMTAPLLEAGLLGRLDLVVSNPPYVREDEFEGLPVEVRDHEPREALVSGPLGTECLARIIEAAPAVMAKGGRLILEISPDQSDDVKTMMTDAGFIDVTLTRDYAGRFRVVAGRQ